MCKWLVEWLYWEFLFGVCVFISSNIDKAFLSLCWHGSTVSGTEKAMCPFENFGD